ncbi:MAG TPA: outer membrane protein assembly factor BamE [Nitrospirales bacterium]|nr:outer membrane protein assembly factor BamE [Nitrospirales bacterium]HIN33246.1 outer membrane protein assembly factor BamE [Nitrospirales bacterium]HIO22031.1 outer membrane protein assembly factor BamE [Nitrospirales bacterium]
MNSIQRRPLLSAIILLFAISVLLSACFTVGKSFPDYAVPDIRVGKTTENEIRTLFGSPWRTGMDDGDQTWTYSHYRYSLFGEAKTEDLVIRFDKDGVVSLYTFNTTDPVP